MARPSFLSDMLRNPGQPFTLTNTRSGGIVASRVELAVDSESRRRGLLGRERFEPGSALVIAPCSGIHTFFMRFAIDVAFVSRAGRVLKVRAAIPRGRISLRPGAFAVVELPAGTLAAAALEDGDILALVTAAR